VTESLYPPAEPGRKWSCIPITEVAAAWNGEGDSPVIQAEVAEARIQSLPLASRELSTTVAGDTYRRCY